MKIPAKQLFSLSILLCLVVCSNANEIDTLSSKESVRLFLINNLKGVYEPNSIASLYRSNIKIARTPNLYADSVYYSTPDTVFVQDPITMAYTLVINEPEPLADSVSLVHCPDTVGDKLSSFDEIFQVMEQQGFQYYKEDIDGNGYTDLIVDAGKVLVVMDNRKGLEGYLLSDSPDFSAYKYKRSISLPGGGKGLELERRSCPDRNDTTNKSITTRLDTVVYRHNGFAKYNAAKNHKRIEKILYEYIVFTGMCDVTVSMEIHRDGKCYLSYSEIRPTLTSKLDRATINELWQFAEYVDIRSYKSGYGCWIDHFIGCTIVIYFDDGTAKGSQFKGFKLPMELGYLSRKLSDISYDQNWQLMDTSMNLSIPAEQPLIEEETVYEQFKDCDCLW